uniref:Uncharacterized protein n=1 Tax=Arundo donax TaxID=35708 RepID=A0A0A9GMY9_ARUDO
MHPKGVNHQDSRGPHNILSLNFIVLQRVAIGAIVQLEGGHRFDTQTCLAKLPSSALTNKDIVPE